MDLHSVAAGLRLTGKTTEASLGREETPHYSKQTEENQIGL